MKITTKPEDQKSLIPVTPENDDERSIGKHYLVIDIDMCKVKKNDQTMLEYSVNKNHLDLLKILTLDEKSPKIVDGKPLLHVMAAAGGNSHQVKKLLFLGINVNTKDESGRTALHYVALNSENDSHYCTAEVLFEEGANIMAKDKEGRTPMDYFLRSEHKKSNPRVRELFINYMAVPIKPLKMWLDDCEGTLSRDDLKIKSDVEMQGALNLAKKCMLFLIFLVVYSYWLVMFIFSDDGKELVTKICSSNYQKISNNTNKI